MGIIWSRETCLEEKHRGQREHGGEEGRERETFQVQMRQRGSEK